MPDENARTPKSINRRDFLKSSTAFATAAMATPLATPIGAYAAGSDKIRVGLIGCGHRGTTDARIDVNSTSGVELYAMGDLFQEKRGRNRRMGMNEAHQWLSSQLGEKMNVPKERQFVGWDACKRVLETDVDLVLLTTPPHFRPMQFKAAVEAGKHVFMEKPIAIDPVGVRSVIDTAAKAKQKGLAVGAGTQMRHRADYLGVMKRIHDGQIGEVLNGRAYYNTSTTWSNERLSDMSDMEWMIRNWYHFNWLSGDFITEQSVHKIDILNWGFGGPPDSCLAMGGRVARQGEGNIFDHFAVEYAYGDANATNMCQQIDGATARKGEFFVGSKGKAVSTGAYGLKIVGENPWQHEGNMRGASAQLHDDLITSIRKGQPLNEGKRVAESTMTAIMGRMAAYTGRQISWKWLMNQSKLDLGPDKYEFGSYDAEPIPTPGQTKLI